MSRSALWRQEAGVEDRERKNREIYETALLEGKNRQSFKGLIPMVIKDEDTFNLHPTLLRSLCSSQYFLKLCQSVYDWNALVDTIYYDVQHVEPWMTQGSGTGAIKVPSQAFCLLLRLLTLRCTEKQMHLMLNHADSPHIRCIGFLYLRYVADPNTLLSWCKPFLFDEEPVQVVAAHKSQSKHPTDKSSTVGSFVRSILLHMDYYGTLLPRLPINVEKNIKVKLAEAEEMESRAQHHLANPHVMKYLQTVGNPVRALYQDEENPIAWYDAVIDRVIVGDSSKANHPESNHGTSLMRPTFVVTFSEYGNTETVTLGEMDLPMDSPLTGSKNYKRTAGGQQYGDRYHPREDEYRHDASRREYNHPMDRNKPYASRPISVKESMTRGQQSSYNATHPDNRDSSCGPSKRARIESPPPTTTTNSKDLNHVQQDTVPKQQKTQEDMAAIAEKKRKLLSRYG